MVTQFSKLSQTQAELDLLATLFGSEIEPYPWHAPAADPQTNLVAMEQTFQFDDFSTEETASRAQALFDQFDLCWLITELSQQFAAVPRSILDSIVYQARQLSQTASSLAEGLVECVRELFPHWAETDLQVLARPFAYAMRGTDGVESTIAGVRSLEWTELSEIEQARLSLAVARHVLKAIDTP